MQYKSLYPFMQIPVYLGSSEALIEESYPEETRYHGDDGFGDFNHEIEPNLNVIKKENAVNAIYRLVVEVSSKCNCFSLINYFK